MRHPRKITTKAQLPTAKDWKPTPPPPPPPPSVYQPDDGYSWLDTVFTQNVDGVIRRNSEGRVTETIQGGVRTVYDDAGRPRIQIGVDLLSRDDDISATQELAATDYLGLEQRLLAFASGGTLSGRTSSRGPNLSQRPRIGRLLQAAGFTETSDETRPAPTSARLTGAMQRLREAADRAGASLASAAAAFAIPRAVTEGFEQAERERIRQEAISYNSPIQAGASDRAALFSAMYGMSDARVHYIRDVDFQAVSPLREVSSLAQVAETPGTFYVDMEASWSPGAFREWFDNIEVQTDDDVCPPKFDRTVWNDPRQREAPHARFLSENASFTRRRR